ncbi:uncharacterized protein DUF4071 [Pseudoduganella flava]|uniref:DUF4071 domain-containing protein n=1 Tax=Pseudoduganella flava TaxID=871742 RepID=A0A562Q170_9BURK|nr:TRAFs-binding domain-containing protein [Pseudoduganella flava]QGZ38098.1 DUF4071 domain-containing protein [Pseudoduganella flava]TWI50388.1 uncharacterized protein DUF4071 [Pseudoduganella flava]
MKPLCFVLMPFGRKADAHGRTIDFDAVYRQAILPAITAAGMESLRADEEAAGGIIHKPMFERLVLCDFAIADLTGANANVFYELGVRHAARPHTTILLFAEGGMLPFDVAALRALPYLLQADGTPADAAGTSQRIGTLLRNSRRPVIDSPLYQLLNDYPDIQRDKTDVFRGRVAYSQGVKTRLASARRNGRDAVWQVERDIDAELRQQGTTGLADAEAGILVDLLLSYRATEAWHDMLRLVELLPAPLDRTVLVREQQAFALNRAGDDDAAERMLRDLLRERGPNSETCGLLGRVYKGRWQQAAAQGRVAEADGWLRAAIDVYRQGFESDWRDTYPGINLLTLMECAAEQDAERAELLPVVLYAARRRLAAAPEDYWNHATMLELHVLRDDRPAAQRCMGAVLNRAREAWEPDTTAANLTFIADARRAIGRAQPWYADLIAQLRARSAALRTGSR